MKKTIYISLMIIATVFVVGGLSYAYFTAIATSDEQVTESGTLRLTYLTGQDITLENVFPSNEENAGIHQFAIENTGTLEAIYYLYLDDIILQKNKEVVQSENLKWKLYKADEGYAQREEIISGTFNEKVTTIELDTEIIIQPKEKQYYILKVWLQETGKEQNEDQGLEFGAKVEATTERKAISRRLVDVIKKEAVMDNIASTYVTSPTGIDFSQISSDTNGKGLYILHGTENDEYPIMYYRGAVVNNNVKFANFCWKIVRTTDTGGIKLIYNGAPDEQGQCTATESSTMIGNSAFNTNSSDNTHVGYMYGTAGSSSYSETHKNTNNSAIKVVIDEWYSQNMIEYTNELEDIVWCNDRSISSGSGIGIIETYYGAYNRLIANKMPTLECVNENDRFTVSEENGNGALTYPMALLSGDEVVYAGGVYGMKNTDYYLWNNQYWWAMTPDRFGRSVADEFLIYAEGYSGTNMVHLSYGVRPAISLKEGIKVIYGGDGTKENPYVVE